MNKGYIQLFSIDDVNDFVRAVEKCDFPVMVSKEGYSLEVDGKSVIGIANLLGGKLIVQYGGENEELDKALKKYAFK